MKETLTKSEIAHRLFSDENAGWSYNGAKALAEYLDTDENENAEFDRVAIRCDFCEYASLQDWAEDYFEGDWKMEIGIAPDCIEEGISDIALDQIIRMHILDKCGEALIEFDGGVIVSRF